MEMMYQTVEVYNYTNKEDFLNYTSHKRVPLLVRGLDLGESTTKWTTEYLADTIKSQPVTIHVSPTGKMSFLKKNFKYTKIPFDEFIRRASGEYKDFYKPILCENEVLYFRSISSSKKGKVCTDLSKDFPSIANDFKIPEVFNSEDFFSSVFRIASPRMEVWTHYDVLDNILAQIQGTKEITLFSPEDAEYLYLIGDKSEVNDVHKPDLKKFPLFLNAVHYKCTLMPGDALFIPALWFHTTVSPGLSINVNVFWKNLPHDLYEKNDIYGNKDLIAANKAFLHAKKAIEALRELPKDYRRFYTRRCMADFNRSLNESFDEAESRAPQTSPPLAVTEESNGQTEIQNTQDLVDVKNENPQE